jgi:predicted aldo/keto reductase-like oxidoreductase
MGGNLSCIHLAQKHDMGVFIISPTDKGGGLYEPPRTFTEACLPLTPIGFNNLFLWAHDPPIHTIVIGMSLYFNKQAAANFFITSCVFTRYSTTK